MNRKWRQLLECAGRACTLHGFPIPTGLCLPAQGCEERATLGTFRQRGYNPNGVAAIPVVPSPNAATLSGLYSLSPHPQGSSFLATLGLVPESLWDSISLWAAGDPYKEQGRAQRRRRFRLGRGGLRPCESGVALRLPPHSKTLFPPTPVHG